MRIDSTMTFVCSRFEIMRPQYFYEGCEDTERALVARWFRQAVEVL
jgi:hypothetical protein